jgi:hypothetical protein
MPFKETIGAVTIDCTIDYLHSLSAVRGGSALTQAINTAPQMVGDAIAALHGHLAKMSMKRRVYTEAQRKFQGQLANDPNITNVDHTEVGQGLVKYFHLKESDPSCPTYWPYIHNIVAMFTKIQAGLTRGYTLKLWELEERGQVRGLKSRDAIGVSEIRQTFGFNNEYGNRQYFPTNYSNSPIEIGYEWVKDAQNNPSWLARTIIHEASHKFAATKDILYKTKRFPTGQIFPIDGRTKGLLPMMGYVESEEEPEYENVLVDPVRLLENADSYAWFARRMSKRWGNVPENKT